jgi:hypothetical protein
MTKRLDFAVRDSLTDSLSLPRSVTSQCFSPPQTFSHGMPRSECFFQGSRGLPSVEDMIDDLQQMEVIPDTKHVPPYPFTISLN